LKNRVPSGGDNRRKGGGAQLPKRTPSSKKSQCIWGKSPLGNPDGAGGAARGWAIRPEKVYVNNPTQGVETVKGG